MSEKTYMTHKGEWGVPLMMCLGEPLSAVTDPYFAEQTPEYQTRLAEHAEALNRNATPAFREVTTPAVMPVEPVAAHQEYDYIGPMLTQLTKQKRAPPHRTNLFCNWPPDCNGTKVEQTLDTITAFQREHPCIPLSYFAAELPPDTTIATIRKQNWDVGLFALPDKDRRDDILMLEFDADITYLSPLFLAGMYLAFTSNDYPATTAVFPRHHHKRSGGRLPNMDRVAAWYDLTDEMLGDYYELGCGLSARAYCVAGFEEDTNLSEFHEMMNRIHQFSVHQHPGIQAASRAVLRSSSRRLYDAMFKGRQPGEFWKGGFGMNDSYRTDGELSPDISEAACDYYVGKLVAGGYPRNFRYQLANFYQENGYTKEAAKERADEVVRLGKAILGFIGEDRSC